MPLNTLKRNRFLSFFRRTYYASTYYNRKYGQILRWGITSREDTNFTYDLTEANIIYLAQTISVVTGIDYKTILEYINEARTDEALKQFIAETIKKSSFRGSADLNIFFGRRLGWYAIARAIKPKITVETGVDKGMGSVLLCAAIQRNQKEGFSGRYIGTDINPRAGYLLSGPYADFGKILYGDSIQSLTELKERIDLFINDSDHAADYEFREYLAIKDKLSKNAVVLGDNSHISNKLSLFSIENGRCFLFFREQPRDHWYPGAGIGISFTKKCTDVSQ
jgi:hypothetical protein